MQLNNAPLFLTARGFLLVNLGPSRPLLIGMKCELRDFVDWVLIKPWFYSICSVQSCPFVQCWPGIFLVRENLCNVDEAFVATGYRQNFDRFKKKIAEKWWYSDIALGFFLCNVVWSLLGNIAQDFCQCSVVPRVLRQYWTGFFHVQCCLEPLGQHCTRFLPGGMLAHA